MKTIPFTATHTYIAHIWQYPPPPPRGSWHIKRKKSPLPVDVRISKTALLTLKIKKIGFSAKVSIQPCRPKPDLALPGAIGAQFSSKKLNQKAIPDHSRAHFSPGTKSDLANWTVLALI